MITGHSDTDLDRDVHSKRLGPSTESLNCGRPSAPKLSDFGASQCTTGSEAYPALGAERNIPLSKEEIEEWQKLGHQRGLVRNTVRFEYCVPRHTVLVY